MRPLDCSRRSTNDLLGRHPASTGGTDNAGAAAGVGGQAARLRREVGEGPLSSTSTKSMVTRVALGGPSASLPNPSPRHLLPRIAQSPSTTLRTADRSGVRASSRERGALVQRHLAPLADPRRRVGLRARVCYAREDGGRSMAWHSDARPRRQLSPEGPARARSTRRPPLYWWAWAPSLLGAWGRPSQLHGGFRRQCDAQKFGIWDKKTLDTFGAPHLRGPYKVRR